MKRTSHQTLVGLMLCGLISLSFATLSSAAWKELKPMPTHRWGVEAAAVGMKIYAIGGQDDTPEISKNEEYDIAKDKWVEKKPIPTGRVRHTAVSLDGKVYVIGGTRDGIAPLAEVEVYDPKTDTWERKADMLTPRIAPVTVVLSGKIYTVGGATDVFFPSPAIEVYNPVTDAWEQKADMPNPRWGAAGAAIPGKGKIYIFGGATDFTHKKSTTDVDEYDTKTEIWTPKAKIQRPVHNFAAAFVNSGMIYVMGGEKFKGKGGIKGGGNDPDLVFYDDVWEYSPEENKMRRMDSMPTARGSFGTAVADGKIYTIGGWNGGAGAGEIENEAYQPPGWPFPAKFSVDPRGKLATIWGALKAH